MASYGHGINGILSKFVLSITETPLHVIHYNQWNVQLGRCYPLHTRGITPDCVVSFLNLLCLAQISKHEELLVITCQPSPALLFSG